MRRIAVTILITLCAGVLPYVPLPSESSPLFGPTKAHAIRLLRLPSRKVDKVSPYGAIVDAMVKKVSSPWRSSKLIDFGKYGAPAIITGLGTLFSLSNGTFSDFDGQSLSDVATKTLLTSSAATTVSATLDHFYQQVRHGALGEFKRRFKAANTHLSGGEP